jgi:hypothetical protein
VITVRPYDEPEHRALLAALKLGPVLCWRGCHRRATTVDHVPALARHTHRAGTRCCELRPACPTCNYSAGSRLARRARRSPTTSRAW